MIQQWGGLPVKRILCLWACVRPQAFWDFWPRLKWQVPVNVKWEFLPVTHMLTFYNRKESISFKLQGRRNNVENMTTAGCILWETCHWIHAAWHGSCCRQSAYLWQSLSAHIPITALLAFRAIPEPTLQLWANTVGRIPHHMDHDLQLQWRDRNLPPCINHNEFVRLDVYISSTVIKLLQTSSQQTCQRFGMYWIGGDVISRIEWSSRSSRLGSYCVCQPFIGRSQPRQVQSKWEQWSCLTKIQQ